MLNILSEHPVLASGISVAEREIHEKHESARKKTSSLSCLFVDPSLKSRSTRGP